MNGPQHYAEAERLLDIASATYEQAAGVDREVDDDELRWMQTSIEQAKVHATLAAAAATIDALPPSEPALANAWGSVTSSGTARSTPVCMIPDCGCTGEAHP